MINPNYLEMADPEKQMIVEDGSEHEDMTRFLFLGHFWVFWAGHFRYFLTFSIIKNDFLHSLSS